jgi:hypothetical protein
VSRLYEPAQPSLRDRNLGRFQGCREDGQSRLRRILAPAGDSRRTAAFRELLATRPPPDTNTVIVTHTPNIVAALGKDWSADKEGEAPVFRPANDACTLIARVQMADRAGADG